MVITCCRNLHDQEVPINVQSTCVRLMLNLVEVVMQRRQNATLPDLEAYRGLVASILATLSDKLAAVARNTPALMAEGRSSSAPCFLTPHRLRLPSKTPSVMDGDRSDGADDRLSLSV